MTALSPGQSPPPVSIPIRIATSFCFALSCRESVPGRRTDGQTNAGPTNSRSSTGAGTPPGHDVYPGPDRRPSAAARPTHREAPAVPARYERSDRCLDARLGVAGGPAAPPACRAYVRLRSADEHRALLVLHRVLHSPPAPARVRVAAQPSPRGQPRRTA